MKRHSTIFGKTSEIAFVDLRVMLRKDGFEIFDQKRNKILVTGKVERKDEFFRIDYLPTGKYQYTTDCESGLEKAKATLTEKLGYFDMVPNFNIVPFDA